MKRAAAAALGVLILFAGCEKKEERPAKSETAQEAPKAEQIKITTGAVKPAKTGAKEQKQPDKGEFYYSYNKKSAPKEAAASKEDEARYTKLGAYRYVKNYQDVQIALLANKLSKDFLIYCSACHDDYANGVIGPSLLGKSGDYIYEQLMEFKSGKRKNVLMEQLVRRLPDEKLKALAEEIAEFNKKVQKIKAQTKG